MSSFRPLRTNVLKLSNKSYDLRWRKKLSETLLPKLGRSSKTSCTSKLIRTLWLDLRALYQSHKHSYLSSSPYISLRSDARKEGTAGLNEEK